LTGKGRPPGYEQTELTKLRIRVANLEAAAKTAVLKLEDARRALAELESVGEPTSVEDLETR
jgi:hypothetical protein